MMTYQHAGACDYIDDWNIYAAWPADCVFFLNKGHQLVSLIKAYFKVCLILLHRNMI